MDIEEVAINIAREKEGLDEAEQPTTNLIDQFATKAESIYLRRTAGDLTWEGLLYSFLEQYRESIEASWDEVETEEWDPVFVEVPISPAHSWEYPKSKITRTFDQDTLRSQSIHATTQIMIEVLARDEAALIEVLEGHLGRRI